MERIYTFRRTGEDFFVFQVHNTDTEQNKRSVHTFFCNKSEIEKIVRESLRILGAEPENKPVKLNNIDL